MIDESSHRARLLSINAAQKTKKISTHWSWFFKQIFSPLALAACFLVIAFALFGQSVLFLPGGFMAWAIGNPLTIMMASAFAIIVIWVRQMGAVIVTPPTQAILSARQALFILSRWQTDPAIHQQYRAILLDHIDIARRALRGEWRAAFLTAIDDDALDVLNDAYQSIENNSIALHSPSRPSSIGYEAGYSPTKEEDNIDALQRIFTALSQATIDPAYRPKPKLLQDGRLLSKWKIALLAILSALFLCSSTIILFYIFIGAISATSITLSTFSAAFLGFLSWLIAKYLLNNIKSGVYGELAAFAGAIFIVATMLLILFQTPVFAASSVAILITAGSSLAFGLIFGLTIPLALLAFIGFARKQHQYNQADAADKLKILNSNKAQVLRFSLKMVFIIGFMLLVFMSISVMLGLNLNFVGPPFSDLLNYFNKLVSDIGGNATAASNWSYTLLTSIVAISSFAAFKLLESVLQQEPINVSTYEKYKHAKWILLQLFRVGFTSGILIIMMLHVTSFIAWFPTAILPIFLMTSLVIPIFAGNTDIPVLGIKNTFNRLFGVEQIAGKNKISHYVIRELLIISILVVMTLAILFFTDNADSILYGSSINFPLTLLLVSIAITELLRVFQIIRNEASSAKINDVDEIQRFKTTQSGLLPNQKIQLINGKQVLLTYDTDPDHGKVVKVEIYVTRQQRQIIAKHFQDRETGWKQAAPHYLLMQATAAYRQNQLTPKHTDHVQHTQEASLIEQPFTADKLATLIAHLSTAAAPLYSMVNDNNFDAITHPDHEAWIIFKQGLPHVDEPSLKVAFLRERLTAYNEKVQLLLTTYSDQTILEIENFRHFHTVQMEELLTQLEDFSSKVLIKSQLRKLYSNQNEAADFPIISLGGFLRKQAHSLAAHAIAEIDRITDARFEQLFSASAHPLRRELVKVKSDLAKQLGTHAVRFINTSSPIPKAQLMMLQDAENDDAGSFTEDRDEKKLQQRTGAMSSFPAFSAKPHEKWLDVMPYVRTQQGGIDGAAGLNDIDAILRFYADIEQQNQLCLKYPKSFLQCMIDGEKGFLGILGIPFVIIFLVAGFFATLPLGIAIDLTMFALRLIAVTWIAMLLVLPAAALDLVTQLVLLPINALLSNLGWKELDFSFLKIVAQLQFMPDGTNEFLRTCSAVRIMKQYFLDRHKTYINTDTVAPSGIDTLMCVVKKNQAEGLFNVIATKYLSVSFVADWVREKIKQLIFSLREFIKVLVLTKQRITASRTPGGRHSMREQQRSAVFKQVIAANEERRSAMRAKFTEVIGRMAAERSSSVNTIEEKKCISSGDALPEEFASAHHKKQVSNLRWPPIKPWLSKEYSTPMDFLCEIILVLTHQLVDPAFEENSGIATPAFAISMVSLGSMLFPHLMLLGTEQVQHVFQAIPEIVAKNFMGKELSLGMASMTNSTVSVFLQWKLLYFGIEGAQAFYHGDIEFLESLIKNQEEIIFGAATLITVGYGIGLVPELPTVMFHSFSNPVLNAMAQYGTAVANMTTGLVNWVSAESVEVSKHATLGFNSLELAFLGLKSGMLAHMLFSSMPGVHLKLLQLDDTEWQQLIDAFIKEPRIFSDITPAEEKIKLMQEILRDYLRDEHNISEDVATWFLQMVQQANDEAEKTQKFFVLPTTKAVEKEEVKSATALSSDQVMFIEARNHLKQRLDVVREMELWGVGPSAIITADGHDTGYQSKNDAELMFDELSLAFDRHNEAAAALGLFHEKIDGREFLHNFYNKYCYSDSTGLQKLLTVMLLPTLLPLLWWAFKWWIGNPAMRQEVNKNFSVNMVIPLQFIFDIGAPMVRTIIKSFLYTLRMVLGFLLGLFWLRDKERFIIPATWLLLLSIILIPVLWIIELLLAIPVGIFTAFDMAIRRDNAQKFVDEFAEYFNWFSGHTMAPLWNTFKKNANPIMAFLSKWVGGIFVAKPDETVGNLEASAKNLSNSVFGLHRAGLFIEGANKHSTLPVRIIAAIVLVYPTFVFIFAVVMTVIDWIVFCIAAILSTLFVGVLACCGIVDFKKTMGTIANPFLNFHKKIWWHFHRLTEVLNSVASWYERLTRVADTNSEDLSEKLRYVAEELVRRPSQEVLKALCGSNGRTFSKLVEYARSPEFKLVGLRRERDMEVVATLASVPDASDVSDIKAVSLKIKTKQQKMDEISSKVPPGKFRNMFFSGVGAIPNAGIQEFNMSEEGNDSTLEAVELVMREN